jgi:hypothetical protein
MAEGFIEGTKGKPAKHLTGAPLLPTEALTTDGIDASQIGEVTARRFIRARAPELYEPPLVLIRENESLPIAFWNKHKLAFKDKVVGIHADREDAGLLLQLCRRIERHRDTLRFAVTLNGSQALVGKATALLKGDIETLPFPADESELQFTFWESALAKDTLNYFAEFVRRGQNSALLRRTADAEALREYSMLYCRMLGSIYTDLRPGDPLFLEGLICHSFFFGDEPAIEWLGPDCEEQLKSLVFDESFASLRTTRVVRFYHENVVFIVKPDRLRYWIPSTAIRDADDTLIDLQRQGY